MRKTNWKRTILLAGGVLLGFALGLLTLRVFDGYLGVAAVALLFLALLWVGRMRF